MNVYVKVSCFQVLQLKTTKIWIIPAPKTRTVIFKGLTLCVCIRASQMWVCLGHWGSRDWVDTYLDLFWFQAFVLVWMINPFYYYYPACYVYRLTFRYTCWFHFLGRCECLDLLSSTSTYSLTYVEGRPTVRLDCTGTSERNSVTWIRQSHLQSRLT